jgi:adenine/guanine phosphoribosyltransferase-like PRPP-binding protein
MDDDFIVDEFYIDETRVIGHYGYQEPLHNPTLLLDTAVRIADAIRAHVPASTSYIAVSGMSGAVVGAVVSTLLNMSLIIIRKNGEQRHSEYVRQGPHDAAHKTYIIIDDLIDSGKTVDYILNINEEHMCAGIFLYHEREARRSYHEIPVWRV